jgi:thiamine biosynthesis lipoprotein
MKAFAGYLCVMFCCSLCISCQEQANVLVRFTGSTQGTYYAVTYYEHQGKSYQKEIDSLLVRFDKSVSLWDSASVISRINRNDENAQVDEVFAKLFQLSKEVHLKSGGAFDPTVGPLVNAWGFGFKEKMKVDQRVVDSLLQLVGFEMVKLENGNVSKFDPRVQFDFNAIAQGYSVDLVGGFLLQKGIKNYLVDIGGEVKTKGHKPGGELWQVGIERPRDHATYGEGLTAIVKLTDKALSTSGSYRKFYIVDGKRYSHTIDPKTGYPVQHSLLSVSVLADECAMADAWATVFMVWGFEKSRDFLETQNVLQAFFIYADSVKGTQTYNTPGFDKFLVEEMR